MCTTTNSIQHNDNDSSSLLLFPKDEIHSRQTKESKALHAYYGSNDVASSLALVVAGPNRNHNDNVNDDADDDADAASILIEGPWIIRV